MLPRRARTAAAVLALTAGLPAVALARPSAAQPGARAAGRQEATAAKVEDLQDEVEDASAEERALKRSLDDVEAQRERLDARLARLTSQVTAVEAEARAAQARLDEVQATYVVAQTGLAEAHEQLAVEHDRLRRQATAAYVGNPLSTGADLFLRAGSLREVAATGRYLDVVSDVQREAVRRYSARRDATDALRRSVEGRKDEARRQRDLVVNRLADLEGLQAEHQAVAAELAAEERRQGDLLAEVQQRRAAFESQLALLAMESSGVVVLLQGLLAPGAAVGRLGAGTLAHPVPGASLTSSFGPRTHPIFGTVRMHEGVDFAAPTGTPVRAAANGTVVWAGERGGYGNATIVSHGSGVATLYAHQSLIAVTVGTPVVAGQVIGSVGSTGFSTGPHLHFEVRVGGTPVDPLGGLVVGVPARAAPRT